MIALIIAAAFTAWFGVGALVAVLIGKAIALADREQAAGQAHFEAELERWDMLA